MVGFSIWSAVALLLLGIGIHTRFSPKAAGFFAGVDPPRVKNVRAYNRAVSVLWIGYALGFEAAGVPLLFLEQNSPLFLIPLLLVPALTILLVVIYHAILSRFRL